MNVEKIRSWLIKILLGTLIATSAVAVGVILMGSVTDMVGKVIWTFVAGIFYVSILLAILSTIPHIGTGPKSRSSLFVVNSLLALTCASYLTSILSIWTVIDGDLPWKIHLAYIVLLAAIVYAKPLINLEMIYPKIRGYIYANYVFIALASILTAIAIVAPADWHLWDGFYGRLIAASLVVSVTLSMVITVLYHLYLQQHPELRAKMTVNTVDGKAVEVSPSTHPQRTSPWLVIGIIVALFIGLPMAMGVLGALSSLLFGARY